MSLSLGGKGVAFTTPRCCGNEVAGLKPRQPTALPMEDFTSPEVSEESSGKFRQQNNRVKSDCYALKTKDFPIMSLIPKWFTHLHATVHFSVSKCHAPATGIEGKDVFQIRQL